MSRPGWAGRVSIRTGWSASPPVSGGRPGSGSRASGRISSRPMTSPGRIARRPASRPPSTAWPRPGSGCRTAISRPAPGCSAGWSRLRRRADRTGYLRHRPRRRPVDRRGERAGGGAAADPVAPRPTGPGGRSPGRDRDQLWPDLHHRAAEPDRDAAAGLRRRLPAGALEPGRGARPGPPGAARRQRGDGRGDGRRDRRARPAGHHRRRVRLVGTQGAAAIPIEDLARLRTTNTWETVTALSRRLPRVYHAAAVPVATRSLALWRDR